MWDGGRCNMYIYEMRERSHKQYYFTAREGKL